MGHPIPPKEQRKLIYIVKFNDYRGELVVEVTVEAVSPQEARDKAHWELTYECDFDPENLEVEIEAVAEDQPVKRIDFAGHEELLTLSELVA